MGNINWEFTWAVVIVGLVVVFSILIALVLLCTLSGYVFKKIDKTKNSKDEGKKSEPVAQVNTPKNAPVKMEAPVVEDGITGDVVAAISAAVAVIMGNDKPFAIKSVKRSRGARSAWNNAAIIDNTRPF